MLAERMNHLFALKAKPWNIAKPNASCNKNSAKLGIIYYPSKNSNTPPLRGSQNCEAVMVGGQQFA